MKRRNRSEKKRSISGRFTRLAVLSLAAILMGCGPRSDPAYESEVVQAEPPVPVPRIPEIPISRLDESPVVGRFEVVDYHITPVAAIDEETAITWLGQLLIYSAEYVGVQEELCDKPTFREHVESFAEYFEDFEVNAAQFDIQDPDVDVVSVDCYGESWKGPGSEVIRVRGDSLVVVYDGVFLTMEPYVSSF